MSDKLLPKEPESVFYVRCVYTSNLTPPMGGYRPATVEDITEPMVVRATDAVLRKNLSFEDGGDGKQLTHAMARRRARAALEAVFRGD